MMDLALEFCRMESIDLRIYSYSPSPPNFPRIKQLELIGTVSPQM